MNHSHPSASDPSTLARAAKTAPSESGTDLASTPDESIEHPVIAEFTRSDSPVMVAAALNLLGLLADDAEKRHAVVAPWAWDLRQRARALEAGGMHLAAAQAKIVARMVSAVALGEVTSGQLLRAAEGMDVEAEQLQNAIGVLESAMLQERA